MIQLFRKIRVHGFKKSAFYAAFEIRQLILRRWLRGSFSQDGEDLVLDRLTGNKKVGFYVDVGACDPKRFSNTKMFYGRGWRGINIEPNPDLIEVFRRERPRDINVNCGIGRSSGLQKMFIMFPPTVSTFAKEFADMNIARGCHLIRTQEIEVKPLSEILAAHLPAATEIDFLSIDAEGLDFEVILGNDWSRFRPRVICMESPTQYFPSPVPNRTAAQVQYLLEQGYDLAFHTGMDAFYVRR